MSIRFAVNRTCAPHLPLSAFIALAAASGVKAVEIRNDIEGREFADGTPARDVRAQLDAAGLAVASVNALQRFNEWTPARAKEAEAIISYAAAGRAGGCSVPGSQRRPRLVCARGGTQPAQWA